MRNWKTTLDRHLKCAFQITHRDVIWRTHSPNYHLSNFNSKCAFQIEIQNTHFAVVWKQSFRCLYKCSMSCSMVYKGYFPILADERARCVSVMARLNFALWFKANPRDRMLGRHSRLGKVEPDSAPHWVHTGSNLCHKRLKFSPVNLSCFSMFANTLDSQVIAPPAGKMKRANFPT